jgi:hypothetical protein
MGMARADDGIAGTISAITLHVVSVPIEGCRHVDEELLVWAPWRQPVMVYTVLFALRCAASLPGSISRELLSE